jgi:hypothetical protein
MSRTRQILRPANPDDFRAYSGRDPDPRWCVDWWGEVVEQDGQLIGIGIISRDEYGRLWAWVDTRGPISAFLIHRAVSGWIAGLKTHGALAVHAYCSDRIAGAERWLRRLGFAPDLSLPPADDGRPVWKCDFSA